uniref:ABC transporter substrate-binding protein n=1 Tax=Pseudomonas laurentiana TaxID=2364649 RepID=UPI0029C66A4A|nr:ABC transporter substrate-binding protein [Pseudomonas laurentiana]
MRRFMGALLLAWLWSLTAAAQDILLTAATDSPGVRTFVHALEQQRRADQVRFLPVAELPAPGRMNPATRLILLDTAALDWRLAETAGPPALALRISRVQANQRLGRLPPPYLSMLWSDPPPARQLRLIRYLLPQAQRIGVLYSEHSRFLLDELNQSARLLGLRINAQAWPDPRDNRPLQALLQDSDVVLGLDDPNLYNPRTVKNLLLSSYARQMPLIGPTAGFVKAGGLASTFSDQQDWLRVLDRLLDQAPAKWPRTHYPEHFGVVGNPQVARALGLEPIDPVAATKVLAEGEPTP